MSDLSKCLFLRPILTDDLNTKFYENSFNEDRLVPSRQTFRWAWRSLHSPFATP